MSKSLMESWMDPQAGEKRHEETMISHWFPWFPPPTERRFQILWPQTSAPSTASAGVVQNSTFSSRASYISRSCHNCVVVDLQNQTFNDVENICVHRVHMFILWLHAEMEKSIENPSKLMYTRLHGCVSAERVCVYYIYMFTSYHIMYSWYFWCIHLHWPWLPRLWCEGSAPGPHLHAEGHSSPDGDKQTYGGSEPSEMRTLYAVNQLKATRDENLDQLNSKATIQWEY